MNKLLLLAILISGVSQAQFFEEAKEALNASFRPCLRCQPLSDPDQVSELMQTLITALE